MEAPVFRCQSCGAPVAEDAAQCPYCQSQLATVACPRCFGMVSVHARHCSHCGADVVVRTQPAESAIRCPECEIALSVTPLGEVDIHQCSKCGGVWLEHERFAALSVAHEEQGKAAAAAGARPAPTLLHGTQTIRYRGCPVCEKLMNRFNFGRNSGVILDSCRQHGLWFDREELRRVMAFIDGGGLVRSQEAEAERKQEAARALALAQIEIQHSGAATSDPYEGLTTAPLDLVHTVQGLWHLVQRLKS
jgi:Zn-finger nucleic acid-binding protein/RNA polymerase subunit RPABC4/transcription elongation factor Spt4